MLDSVLAQKLVNKIMKQLGYNINIMNEKGIIVASGDPDRVGSFHEIAYKIIKNNLAMEVVYENDQRYIGVKPGVNMPIKYENEVIGVVGISGLPGKVMDFAHIVRMSAETIIEYELYKERIRKRQSSKNAFINALVHEDPADLVRIRRLAADLGYDEKYIRIPIILSVDTLKESGMLIDLVKQNPLHLKQDISLEENNGRILIFKTLKQQKISSYKEEVLEYTESLCEILSKEGFKNNISFFAGTMQNRFDYYRYSYTHALWLEKQPDEGNCKVKFFMDHLFEYMQSLVPSEILEQIFSVYQNSVDISFRETFVQTIQSIYRSNLNLSAAAAMLYIHRNTLLFRLNKIKEQLQINPVKNIPDLYMLYLLSYYYKKQQQ